MVDYAGQKTKIGVWLEGGYWSLDKVEGKTIFKVGIWDDDHKLVHAPTHDFVCELLSKCLEAELKNDTFVFPDGSKRPTKIFRKAWEIRNVVGGWEWEAKKAGLRSDLE